MERVDQLLANPANWRLHPYNQQQALAGAIDDIGFIRSVTVNWTTGCVLDGHLRVTLAARSGVDSLPVEYVELSEAEEAEALLTLDPIGAMAAADKTKLDELMRQVQSDDARVQQMIADLAEREHIQYGAPPPDDQEGDFIALGIKRKQWSSRHGRSFLAIRSFTTRNKDKEIEYLKKIKAEKLFINEIGQEISDAIVNTIGNLSGFVVVPAPHHKTGFAVTLCQKIAEILSIDSINIFSMDVDPNAKRSIFGDRPEIKIFGDIPDRIIWIDDTATTGRTLQACRALCLDKTFIPVVWVYGDAQKE